LEEDIMRKLGYVVAALGALAVVAPPSLANAETVVIKKNHHGPYGARAEFREHRDYGWHRGWRHHHGDRVVVIKRGHRHSDGY
jgi:hypothetical protein